MKNVDDTIGHRLTITINGADLPIDETVRRTVLGDLRAEVHDVLVERHGFEVAQNDIRVATGYRHAQVPADCPLCGERLNLLSIHMDNANGAFTSAMCPTEDCEWSGDAVYRIIDLEGSETDAFESSVLAGDITPSYHPY